MSQESLPVSGRPGNLLGPPPTRLPERPDSAQAREALDAGTPAAEVAAAWQPDLQRFRARRERYFLYD
jgi:hypothetical protein